MPSLSLIPAWAWIALAAIIAVCAQEYRINSMKAEHAEFASAMNLYMRGQAEAARIEEQRRANVARMEQEKAANEIAKAQADASTARASADSLRKQLAGLRDRLANRDAALAGERKAGRDAIGVLADLLSESVERNRILAEALDRSRIAGMTCERLYNGMNRYEQKP